MGVPVFEGSPFGSCSNHADARCVRGSHLVLKIGWLWLNKRYHNGTLAQRTKDSNLRNLAL